MQLLLPGGDLRHRLRPAQPREMLGELAGELEGAGAALQLGDGYLENLTQDVIFRTPGLRPDVPELREACGARAAF